MKTYNKLFPGIVSEQAFYEAYRRTSLGKKAKKDYLLFSFWEHVNLHNLRFSVINNTYRPQPPTAFPVFDPKPRTISAPKFSDRIVQHAIYHVAYPLFDKTFLPNSYACRRGFGAHKAAKDVQAEMRKAKHKGWWYLKTDFSKYFHSIPRKILWWAIDRLIKCHKTKNLVELFIPRDGVGLHIGSLLSQLFANVFGNIIDMYIKHTLKIKTFFRYMDDIVIFGRDRTTLRAIKKFLLNFCSKLGMRFSKWFTKPLSAGINFVGYRIWATHKLIRKSSIADAKKKLRTLSPEKLAKFLPSWYGHLQHADTFNLKKRLDLIWVPFTIIEPQVNWSLEQLLREEAFQLQRFPHLAA